MHSTTLNVMEVDAQRSRIENEELKNKSAADSTELRRLHNRCEEVSQELAAEAAHRLMVEQQLRRPCEKCAQYRAQLEDLQISHSKENHRLLQANADLEDYAKRINEDWQRTLAESEKQRQHVLGTLHDLLGGYDFGTAFSLPSPTIPVAEQKFASSRRGMGQKSVGISDQSPRRDNNMSAPKDTENLSSMQTNILKATKDIEAEILDLHQTLKRGIQRKQDNELADNEALAAEPAGGETASDEPRKT